MSNCKEYHCVTKLKKGKFKWTIHDFSTVLEMKTKNYIHSPTFEMEREDGEDLITWILFFGPNIRGEFCSLHAGIPEGSGECSAHIDLAILDNKGRPAVVKKIFSDIHLETNPDGNHFGSNTFVRSSYLMANKHKLFPNDELTISCEVVLLTNKMLQPEKTAIKPIFQQNLYKDLAEASKKDEFLDVTLFTQDGPIRANSFILSARSPVFASLLNESNNKQLLLSDVKTDVMMEILDFMYTDSCQKTEDILLNLFNVAFDYEINGLRQFCQKELLSLMCIENAATILVAALETGEETELELKVIDFINANKDKVFETAEWRRVSELWPEHLKFLFPDHLI